MKKFKFRLEKILQYKTRLFDIAKEEYLQAQKALDEAKLVLEKLKQEYQDCLLKLMNRTKRKFNIKELALYYKFIFYKKFEMKQQLEVISNLSGIVDEKKEKLVAISKEKEILSKLKDKKFQNYQYLLSREEQKLIDEMAAREKIGNFT